jgi:hypothetical protein
MDMPIFRILAALFILAMVMPEVLRAPVRYVAGVMQDFAGAAPVDPQMIAPTLARLCAQAPDACTAAAKTLFPRNERTSPPEAAKH